MKRVMFYINQIYEGGAERVMAYLVNAFADAGYESILVTSFWHDGEYKISDKVNRITIEEKRTQQSWLQKNILRVAVLRKACKKYKPDILISFMAEPNLRAMAAAFGLQTRNLISVRGDPDREYMGWKRRFLGKHMLQFADACVFQTEDAKAWFPQKLQKKSRIIMNPVGNRFYKVKRNPVKNKIVACGRLMPIKNHRLLIDAFANVRQKMPDAVLEIYGQGKMEQELQRRINELGITDCAFLMGQTAEMEEVLSKADLFVLTSDAEGMPNALLEALAAGVPCISTDCPCGGPGMVIEDDVNGRLVEVNNTNMLEKRILELLLDRKKLKQLGEKARKRARMFSEETVFLNWKEYVDEVIG